jgi:hypothetical protein
MDTRPPQTAADERAAGVPSGTSLLGLVKHLTFVERFYFLGEDVVDWGKTMRPTPDETADGVLAAYREAIGRANEVIDTYQDLTRPALRPPRRGSAPPVADSAAGGR